MKMARATLAEILGQYNAQRIAYLARGIKPLTTRYSPCELVRWMAKAECGKLPCRRTHWPHLVFRTHSFLAFHIQLSFGTLGSALPQRPGLTLIADYFFTRATSLPAWLATCTSTKAKRILAEAACNGFHMK